MLDPKTAWLLVRNNASKAMSTQMEYHSLIEKRKYKVLSVEKDKITMARLSGGDDAILTQAAVEKAIAAFNNNDGKPMKRRSLIQKPVISETTLVLFHPHFAWDETGEYILELNSH